VEDKLTRKHVNVICVLTRWNLLVMHSDDDNLQIIKELIEACEDNDNLNSIDGE
jgi:hypothetical protein